MRQLLRPFRFLTVVVCLFLFLITMAAVWVFVRGHWQRVRWSNRILTLFCRLGLFLLKVKVNYLGLENVAAVENALYVGNHMSYMDVLVIHARIPTCFVTSVEIKEMPVLGQVCQMAGCLFVERRSKTNIRNEVGEIAEGLREGLNVTIFPEATSTNGEQILRFRRPLYVAALESKKPVVPMCLSYRLVGGQPINAKSRDSICWYGDMDFVSHLWRLSGCGGVEADLLFRPVIHPSPVDDATSLAERSQLSIQSVFRPIA